MLSTLVLAVSIGFSVSVAPDRHVRVAHEVHDEGESVAMSVQSDGSVLKVEEDPKPAKPVKATVHGTGFDAKKIQADDLSKARSEAQKDAAKQAERLKDAARQKAEHEKLEAEIAQREKERQENDAIKAQQKKLQEEPKIEKKLEEPKPPAPTIKEVKSHTTSAVQKDSVTANSHQDVAPRNEIKPHTAEAKVPDAKLHKTEIPKLPEGVVLLEIAETDPEESWKSAFFFFASLVLIVVIVGLIVSGIYFNREQAVKKEAAETVSLASNAIQAPMNDSSSTSDSGEKIAMLFDRVRKSLEDLSEKSPAEQADMAGGQNTPGVNTL